MSVFADTINDAIKDYKQLLKRRMTKPERIAKLAHLKLNSHQIETDDFALYKKAQLMIADIDAEIQKTDHSDSYYSYFGLAKFRDYVSSKINEYYIEGDKIIHKTQRAAAALVQSVQLMSLPENMLDDRVRTSLYNCNKIIADFASLEQQQVYRRTLEKQFARNPEFFTQIINNLNSHYKDKPEEISVALFSNEDEMEEAEASH